MEIITTRRPQSRCEGESFALKLLSKYNFIGLKISVLLVFLWLFCSFAYAQKLTVKPEKPAPGDTLLIEYNPVGGKLENVQDIICTATIYNELQESDFKIELKAENGVYKSKVVTGSHTQLVAFKYSAGKINDDNRAGYIVQFYLENKPVEGVNYLLGEFYGEKDGMMSYGLKTDLKKSISFFENELKLYPGGKNELASIINCYQYAYHLDRITGESAIMDKIELISRKQKNENDYILIYRLYEILKRFGNSRETLDALNIAYPNSTMFLIKRLRAVQSVKSAVEMEKAANELIATYHMSDDPEKKMMLDMVYTSLGKAYLNELNFSKFYFFNNKFTGFAKIELLHEAAQQLSDKHLALKQAIKMSETSLLLLDTLAALQPEGADSLGWQKGIKKRSASYHATCGYLAYQTGDYIPALMHLKTAYLLTANADDLLSANYALALVKNNQPAAALPLFEKVINNGSTDLAIQKAFKDAFIKNGGTVAALDTTFAKLLEAGALVNRSALIKRMINLPAPLFTLHDAAGKMVSLAALKGKIVVLDFWAMWCIPCKEAFPGMQKLINKYAGNKEIVFLFINTLEKDPKAETLKSVQKYMKQNKYTFQVLMDERKQNEGDKFMVADLYKVTTIPMKIVIGRDGNMHFKNSGYMGSDNRVVEELSQLIEAVK